MGWDEMGWVGFPKGNGEGVREGRMTKGLVNGIGDCLCLADETIRVW